MTKPKTRSWPKFFGFSPALASRLSRLPTRSSVSPSPLRSTFGRPNRFRESIFSVCGALSWGADPYYARARFRFSFRGRWQILGGCFEAYGAVKSVKKQTFLSNQNIVRGARLVDVTLYGVLPRFLMVDGYLCRLWYLGQSLVCNLCAVQGHRSANCPDKDKRRKCEKTGHFARNCTFDGSAGDSADFPTLASST